MQNYLYEDLYLLEEKHWWHISKRRTCLNLLSNLKTDLSSLKKSSNQIKILDVGCGTGKNLEFFSKFGKTWGIDNSKVALKFCKKRGLKVKWGQAEKTPFKNSSFDVITLLDVLEHTDDTKTLNEMFRILKKDGVLIITVPAFQWLWSKWDVVLHHKRRYTANSLETILKRNKFKVIKISFMYSYLVLPALIVRTLKTLLFKNQYPSDFKLSNNLLNSSMLFINSIEYRLIERFGLPFGTSIVCIAQKNETRK